MLAWRRLAAQEEEVGEPPDQVIGEVEHAEENHGEQNRGDQEAGPGRDENRLRHDRDRLVGGSPHLVHPHPEDRGAEEGHQAEDPQAAPDRRQDRPGDADFFEFEPALRLGAVVFLRRFVLLGFG